MSVAYHKELFDNGKIKLLVSFSKIKEDVADEDLTLNFYAFDSDGNQSFQNRWILKISEAFIAI